MKEETKRNIKNFTLSVIDIFLSIPEVILASGIDRKDFYHVLQDGPTDKILSCSNICKILHNLKQQRYIEVKKNSNGNESIIFTTKARLAVVDQLANRYPESKEYCLVSFDIPEQLKNNRDSFRRAIKRMGFHQIQKSLWVCNKRLGKLVELASIEYKVSQYVVYFITGNTNVNDYIDSIMAGRR